MFLLLDAFISRNFKRTQKIPSEVMGQLCIMLYHTKKQLTPSFWKNCIVNNLSIK